ncbi:unnamed protein product [Brassicogethes aeneus]|uniref:acid phosphatase n=1 Tax=Brassicogethes aeneus TaxID=1431903 RepID=A0A9P0AUJ4_BRAAE|nr:unnamed protein product [Brassicogethes aeneus]
MTGSLALVLVILIGFSNAKKVKDNDDKLIAVALMFRHGDRTIITTYPNDPYKDLKYWPEGFGQLTNDGKKRHYHLGKWIRKRYSAFLDTHYKPKEIYVKSTDVDRALMSAESNLAGLYKPRGRDVWKNDLDWQPIPIHGVPQSLDNIISMKKKCPKYEKMYDDFMVGPEMNAVKKKYQKYFDIANENSGMEFENVKQFEKIHGVLNIELSKGYDIPKWTKAIFPIYTEKLSGIAYSTGSYNQNLARLKDGPFFYFLTSHFNRILNQNCTENKEGPSCQKLLMLSAHDKTVGNILTALGVYDLLPPPFCATVIFELRNPQQPYVNILYKKDDDLKKLKLKDCKYNCPWEKFLQLTEQITLNNTQWEEECKL